MITEWDDICEKNSGGGRNSPHSLRVLIRAPFVSLHITPPLHCLLVFRLVLLAEYPAAVRIIT